MNIVYKIISFIIVFSSFASYTMDNQYVVNQKKFKRRFRSFSDNNFDYSNIKEEQKNSNEKEKEKKFSPLIWAAKDNQTEMIDDLLTCETLHINVNAQYEGETALSWAMFNLNSKITKKLLNAGVNIKFKDLIRIEKWLKQAKKHENDLSISEEAEKTCRNIKLYFCDLQKYISENCKKKKRDKQRQRMLEDNFDNVICDEDNNATLWWRDPENYLEEGAVRSLVDATIFHDLDHIKYLLGLKLSPFKGSENNNIFAVSVAAARGYVDILKIFFKHKDANIDCTDIKGTPLIWAASYPGGEKSIEFLVEMGADIHAADAFGYNALSWSILKNLTPTTEKILNILDKR